MGGSQLLGACCHIEEAAAFDSLHGDCRGKSLCWVQLAV